MVTRHPSFENVMTAAEPRSGRERELWEGAYQALLQGEATVITRLARQMRSMADSERASGIDPLHTLERLIQLTESYAAELQKPPAC